MPSKKKKYNARFPAGRIKKIMQSDEEIGKVAQAVPVIISRTLELFVESLLTKTLKITNSRNAKTLSTSHMKQCIMSEQRFDFLRELVKNIPDISVAEEAANYNEEEAQSSSEEQTYPDSDTPYDLSMPSTSSQALSAASATAEAENRKQFRQNGSGANRAVVRTQLDESIRAHLKRDSDLIQRLQASGSSSVIKHTTAVGNVNIDYIPSPKLLRCESTPTNAVHHRLQSQGHQQRQRLKHQSQSVPMYNNSASTSTSNPVVKREIPHTQTSIPAPTLSYDFCNKPVVRIDYSKLPLLATAPIAPLSAPPNIAVTHTKTSAFNFNTEPVINIDFSNIVANASSPATAKSPAVAKVSIGLIPPVAASPAHLTTYPKAPMAAPYNCTITSSTATTAANKINPLFELDEDYDNI